MKRARKQVCAGQKVAAWYVLEVQQKQNRIVYKCRCVCGTEQLLAGIRLWNGTAKDCGCGYWVDKEERPDKDLRTDKTTRDEVRELVEQGYLPAPEAYTVTDGEAVWGFDAIAMILGVDRDTLFDLLLERGERFASGGRLSNFAEQGTRGGASI